MDAIQWPKKPIYWIENKTLYVSIPFTWTLPQVEKRIRQRPIFDEWQKVIVGGPAVQLMPNYFKSMPWVSVKKNMVGIMQKINPMATITTRGCIRKCPFCAVPKIEGNFRELKDWPNLPIITDNNLLAASKKHFNKVIDKLKKFNDTDFNVDFNQGIDARLLTPFHAARLAELKKPVIRLALDSMKYIDSWMKAFEKLRNAGLPKHSIRSYALIGFNDTPKEAWERCEFIDKLNIKVLPMWFHALDQLQSNIVTKKQKKLGWTEIDRKMIMGYFYRHRYPKERARYFRGGNLLIAS